MKQVFLLLILFCATVQGIAQVVIDPKGTKIVVDSSKWKITGSNIYSKNSGNVGIGLVNPLYKLDVSAASNPVRFQGLQTGNFAADSLIVAQNGVIKRAAPLSQFAWLQGGNSYNTPGILGTADSYELSFITNGSERMRLDTRGNTYGGGANSFGNNITGGFIHGFDNRVESTGKPSFGMGVANNIDAADYSITVGEANNIKTGTFNFAFGAANSITSGGNHNYVLGEKNNGGKDYLLAFGANTDFSILSGGFALGRDNKISNFLALDAADSYLGASGGRIGIGTTSPATQLHTTGDVRFQGLGTNSVNTNIVTTDAIGNLTTRSLSSLLAGTSITTLNGLTNAVQTFATGTSGTDFNIVSGTGTHTFNLPTASATNRGALSAANWTTFNNKIGTVTATTAAAVTTAATTATINNAGAFWNANQLQGRAMANTAPTTGQVIAWNGTTWLPAAAAPATTTVSNTNTAPNSLTTTVNGVIGAAVPIVNSVSNNLSGSNLTTTVNGVTGAAVNLSSLVPATTNTISLSGNTITSTVNGVSATSNSVSSVANNSSGNNLTTTVNGVAASTIPIVNSVANSSSGNTLTTTINGVTGSAAPIVNTVANNLSGTNLTTIVNGITGAAVNLSSLIPATTNTIALSGNTITSTVNGVPATSNSVSGVSNTLSGTNLTTTVNGVTGSAVNLSAIIPATTHSMALSSNTITSTVNGVAATSNSVSTVTNTSSGNTLSTTVNGVAGANVNIINSNALSLSSGTLTSAVNGVAGSSVNVLATANNGLTATNGNVQLGGALNQASTIATTSGNTIALTGLQTGTTADSLLVISSGSGIIRKLAAPQTFPQLLVDARRTTAYTVAAAFSTLVYTTAGINVGTAYNTTSGVFTAPATGLYEVILNNSYNWGAVNNQVVNQIVVNGTVDMEKYISNYPTVTNTNATISGNTLVSLTAGQTISINCGGEIGTVTPLTGAGQHVLKIIRHN